MAQIPRTGTVERSEPVDDGPGITDDLSAETLGQLRQCQPCHRSSRPFQRRSFSFSVTRRVMSCLGLTQCTFWRGMTTS